MGVLALARRGTLKMGLFDALTIRAKLVGGITLLVFVIAAFQVTYFPGQLRKTAIQQLDEKARSITALIANNISAGLEFEDRTMVDQVFSGLEGDPDFLYIAAYTNDQASFLQRGHDPGTRLIEPQWGSESIIRHHEGVLQSEQAVLSRGAALGRLVVLFSEDRIRQQNRENLFWTALTGLLVLLFGALVALGLGYSIGGRIRDFAVALNDVAQGHLDQPPLRAGSADEVGLMAASFNTMIATLRALEDHVKIIAQGNLAREIDIEGDLAASMKMMVRSQRQLVIQIVSTAAEIGSTAVEIVATAQLQERGASEQASVVEETRRTMESLLSSANQVSSAAQKVLADAEEAHSEGLLTTERITRLSGHTDRIAEILEGIKDIANKADLLALNAALEGSKAGEAGRGFSLVATQMQRLTEQIMGAVRDIKVLAGDIREATGASVLATEASTKRASGTSESARQINLISKQQQSGTEQVNKSMVAISSVISESVAAAAQSKGAADQLAQLAERLQLLVSTFELGDQPTGLGSPSHSVRTSEDDHR